jgi:hypothetical protein
MNIPHDVIPLIAADSYRARQLLRMTCRRYCDMLSDYCIHKGIIYCRNEYRESCIDTMFCHLTRAYKAMVCYVSRYDQCLTVGFSPIHDGICILVRVWIDGKLIRNVCALQDPQVASPAISPSQSCTSVDVKIFNRIYKLLSFDIDSTAYLKDNLPELYRVMTIVTLPEQSPQ